MSKASTVKKSASAVAADVKQPTRDRKESEPVLVSPESVLTDLKAADVHGVIREAMRNAKVAGNHRSGRGGTKSKLGTIRVNLCGFNVITSSANTALTAQIVVQPDALQDFSTFAAIYDECRIEAIHLRWRCETAGASPGFQAQIAAIVYDPVASTALTGIQQAGTYSQNSIVAFDVGSTSVGAFACPRPVTSDGFMHFHPRVPSGTIKDNTLAQLIGHEWFDTTSATSMHAGWFKSYIPALGGTVASAIRYILVLRCSFRSRA